jgi:hypothetical protein
MGLPQNRKPLQLIPGLRKILTIVALHRGEMAGYGHLTH